MKAMARILKTPDSGLGPGLYNTTAVTLRQHVPQVTLGMHSAAMTIVISVARLNQ